MPTNYCDRNDIENRLSTEGVSLRLDDVPPDDLGDVIEEASSVIDEHLYSDYVESQLANNRWVKFQCAIIATKILCERRGNPAPGSVFDQFARTLDRLEQVRLGNLNIPGIARRKVPAPVMSNHRAVLRPYPRSVVETKRSTGTVSDYTRPTDPVDRTNQNPLEYFI